MILLLVKVLIIHALKFWR